MWRGGAGVRVEGSAAGAAWGPAATSRPCVAAPLAAAPFHLRRRCVSSIVSHGCVGDTSWSGRSLPRIHRCCPDGRPMRVAKQRRGWRQHHLCHHVHIPTSESMAEQGESRRRDSTIVRRPGVVLPIAVYLCHPGFRNAFGVHAITTFQFGPSDLQSVDAAHLKVAFPTVTVNGQ